MTAFDSKQYKWCHAECPVFITYNGIHDTNDTIFATTCICEDK